MHPVPIWGLENASIQNISYMCVSFCQAGSWIPTLGAFQLACCLLFETEGQWPNGCEWWELENPLLRDRGGSGGVTSTPIHACGLFFMVTATSGNSIKQHEMMETQLMWLKRWKTFTVSTEGKEKIWLLVQKWEWWCRRAGTKYKHMNLVISLSLTTTTKHYKTECLCFLFSCIKINRKSLSTSKSHYLPQENEIVIVCLFIVISNCSCTC